MQKIDAILSQYANILRSKSLRELKSDFHMLGGSIFNGNKEDYINKIVNVTQNNQQALQNVIKLIQNGKQYQQKPATEFKPFLMRQLNRQKLKQIVEIEQTKKGQYAKIGSKQSLGGLLKQQLTPEQQIYVVKRTLQQLKTKHQIKLQKERKLAERMQKNQNKQQNQSRSKMEYSKKNQTQQPKKIKRQLKKLINDYQVQKTYEQIQKQKQQEQKINLLHSLNIQTEIILPNHLIKQNYQHSEQQIKLLLQDQDPNSFSRYLKQKMPKQVRRLRAKQKRIGVIRTLSEAVNVMRMLKQVNYNKIDILQLFMRDIDHDQQIQSNQMNNSAINTRIINQFIKQESKYRKYYAGYMQNYSIQIKIKIAKKILNYLKIQSSMNRDQQEDNLYIALNLFQFSFYFNKNLLINVKKQQNNPEIDKRVIKIAKSIVNQTITYWIKYSRMMNINNLDKLADLFRVLVNFNSLIDYIDNVMGSDQDQVDYGDYYENITKQIHLSFTNLYYPDILPPDLINQLITNFERVLGQAQIPEQILKNIANMANMVNKQLKSEAKKSIIKIFGVRPLFRQDHIVSSLIRHVVQKPILYGLKQSLLAMQLAIKYQFDHKETIIRNIIIFNIDPKELNQGVKQYICKLVKQNVSSDNQEYILSYLK